MLRVFVMAASFALISPARAENPILAADLVGRYWAYKDKCASVWGALSSEEVAALGRVAGALGYDSDDSAANMLAQERQHSYVMRWISVGESTGCTESRVYLRGIAKKFMR